MIKCLLTELGRARRENISALSQDARSSLRSVCMCWPRAKCFPVRPSHTVNKHIPLYYHGAKRGWGVSEELSQIGLTLKAIIVNRGDWLGSPENIKGAKKDAKIFVGRSTTPHNLLFCPHTPFCTLCMNYVTNTFLLVSSSINSKQLLCFVQGQGQKREQKHTTKNFAEFHHHSPLLTMTQYIPFKLFNN